MWPIRKPSRVDDTFMLASPRLQLSRATLNNYDEWRTVRHRNAAYLKPYEPRWADNALTKTFFERRLQKFADHWQDDKTYGLLIFHREGPVLIGGVNINNVVRGGAQSASLGYWLDETYQGQGLMTEALNEVLIFAFGPLELERMNAATLIHNHKSRALLTRLGFEEEGYAAAYIEINGTRQDHILYGLNASDFRRGPIVPTSLPG